MFDVQVELEGRDLRDRIGADRAGRLQNVLSFQMSSQIVTPTRRPATRRTSGRLRPARSSAPRRRRRTSAGAACGTRRCAPPRAATAALKTGRPVCARFAEHGAVEPDGVARARATRVGRRSGSRPERAPLEEVLGRIAAHGELREEDEVGALASPRAARTRRSSRSCPAKSPTVVSICATATRNAPRRGPCGRRLPAPSTVADQRAARSRSAGVGRAGPGRSRGAGGPARRGHRVPAQRRSRFARGQAAGRSRHPRGEAPASAIPTVRPKRTSGSDDAKKENTSAKAAPSRFPRDAGVRPRRRDGREQARVTARTTCAASAARRRSAAVSGTAAPDCADAGRAVAAAGRAEARGAREW